MSRVFTRSVKSGKVTEFVRGSGKVGKLEIFWKKSGKIQGRKFLSTQFFNVNKKSLARRNVCQHGTLETLYVNMVLLISKETMVKYRRVLNRKEAICKSHSLLWSN